MQIKLIVIYLYRVTKEIMLFSKDIEVLINPIESSLLTMLSINGHRAIYAFAYVPWVDAM